MGDSLDLRIQVWVIGSWWEVSECEKSLEIVKHNWKSRYFFEWKQGFVGKEMTSHIKLELFNHQSVIRILKCSHTTGTPADIRVRASIKLWWKKALQHDAERLFLLKLQRPWKIRRKTHCHSVRRVDRRIKLNNINDVFLIV